MERYYIHGVPAEKLILEPEDYSEEEWRTILKVFGMEYAERIVISNYMFEADRLTYEQYKDSDNEEKQSWAEQAKMRANKTASTYNNYILENEYVWAGNVPSDIRMELEYIG